MKKFDLLQDLYERPEGYDGTKNGNPEANEIPKQLTDDHVVEAYKVPWGKGHHLASADDDCYDAVWGIQDGRRNIRQMKYLPEMGKGKK